MTASDRIPSDQALVEGALSGDRDALERLLGRHQDWIYNVALRMVWNPDDAKDVTQEVLLKVATNLSQFRAQSAFSTWLYRITANHVLKMNRRGGERSVASFDAYADRINAIGDADPNLGKYSVEAHLLYEETKVSCMTGMLLCLSRAQRLTLVLGAIMNVSDEIGAEVLGISRANFRQRLSRARRDLRAFMEGQCGLVDSGNPCRCAKKTRGFIAAGVVDPDRLKFVGAHLSTVAATAGQKAQELEAWLALFLQQPYATAGALSSEIVRALEDPRWRNATEA